MSTLSVSNVFQSTDLFQEIISFLEPADLVRVAKVCKPWNQVVEQSQSIWKQLFQKEGIPLVISLDGKARDYKQDFKILYPITLSSKKIGQFLGKMVGGVPPISEEWILKLKEKDPFEEEKSIGQNYVFVVIPSLIIRTVDQTTPLTIDDSGNLIESERMIKEDLFISLSLKNLKVLCSYPLTGKENMPIFDKASIAEVFNQCNTCPDKVRVYFMRKQIANQSRGMTYIEQEELMERHGFEVTPLRERVLFDAITILDSGTCPDQRNPLTYARNPNTVHLYKVYQTVAGGFAPRSGIHVLDSRYDDAAIGVVPGVLAGSSPTISSL